MKSETINATYGSHQTPCTLFTLETNDGTVWYCVKGSQNVNLSPGRIEPGADIEEIDDLDTFTWPAGVNSMAELKKAVEA